MYHGDWKEVKNSLEVREDPDVRDEDRDGARSMRVQLHLMGSPLDVGSHPVTLRDEE